MSKETPNLCNRLCEYACNNICRKPPILKSLGYNDDCPFYAKWYEYYRPEDCNSFIFNSLLIPLCSDCKFCKLEIFSIDNSHICTFKGKRIRTKPATYACSAYKRKWWKFGRL
jgi:hypothetical protein